MNDPFWLSIVAIVGYFAYSYYKQSKPLPKIKQPYYVKKRIIDSRLRDENINFNWALKQELTAQYMWLNSLEQSLENPPLGKPQGPETLSLEELEMPLDWNKCSLIEKNALLYFSQTVVNYYSVLCKANNYTLQEKEKNLPVSLYMVLSSIKCLIKHLEIEKQEDQISEEDNNYLDVLIRNRAQLAFEITSLNNTGEKGILDLMY